MDHVFKISEDFSRFPGGRYKSDGDYSGEHLREDVLLPLLTSDPSCKIHLFVGDVLGLPGAFLEEAFGSLTPSQCSRILLRDRNEEYNTKIRRELGSRYRMYGKCRECDAPAIGYYDYTIEGPEKPLCAVHAEADRSENEAD